MTTLQVAAVIGGALLAFWPQVWALVKSIKLPKPRPAQSDSVNYTEAMIALALVRQRLVETGGVPEDAGHAIEVITHALVEGSHK